ncbi:unnamed protein product, partial [marine sediment metagenome]
MVELKVYVFLALSFIVTVLSNSLSRAAGNTG